MTGDKVCILTHPAAPGTGVGIAAAHTAGVHNIAADRTVGSHRLAGRNEDKHCRLLEFGDRIRDRFSFLGLSN